MFNKIKKVTIELGKYQAWTTKTFKVMMKKYIDDFTDVLKDNSENKSSFSNFKKASDEIIKQCWKDVKELNKVDKFIKQN